MNPIMVVDTEALHRKWVQGFTWHLDLVPELMGKIVEETLPGIPVGGGSRFDKDQITGGGFRDNMTIVDQFRIGDDGRLLSTGPAADAEDLWRWLVSYTAAVEVWLNAAVPVPYGLEYPPVVGRRANPDPLTARGHALVTVGWLIDRADRIATITALEEHREAMFALIRRLRGRYGAVGVVRRARPKVCQVCGERAVVVDWLDGLNGSPKPVQGGKCKNCGQEYRFTEGTDA